ncbi:MAG: PIG-L family deacetylase [Streptosporangiaceae bacterium]
MAEDDQAQPPGRILVVEDDPQAARFTVHVLARWGGFEVTHLADPAAALREATAQDWDLVLTDVEMPGMSGLELLEGLRLVAPDLPVAVVTAHVAVGNAVSALRNRADEFLEKPLQPDRLVATARELIAKGRAARAAGREVVLAIGAHPDDVEIGVGGTLAAHRGRGHEVAILTMSRGARGGPAGERVGESRRAAEILGATLHLRDLEDTRIRAGDPTISLLSEVIADVQPTMIYTHSLRDVHQDHRNVHRAAMVAARQIGRVYCFQSPSATVEFAPTRFVTIDSCMTQKMSAIEAFSSQTEICDYLEPDLIQATARYWSRFGEGRYAEAFEVIRDRADVMADAEPPAGAAVRPARSGAGQREDSHATT